MIVRMHLPITLVNTTFQITFPACDQIFWSIFFHGYDTDRKRLQAMHGNGKCAYLHP